MPFLKVTTNKTSSQSLLSNDDSATPEQLNCPGL